MKKLIAIIMSVLMVISVGILAVYALHQRASSGGEAPVIAFDSDELELSISATEEELLQGVTATDAEDGDVTDSLLVESVSRFVSGNTVKVTYAAFDSQNHVTKATRSIRYTDYTAPHFTLSGPLVFTGSGVADLLGCVGAQDCMDGDISSRVKVSSKDNGSLISSVGSHAVEFRVTNSMGYTAYLPATVEVVSGNVNSAQITLSDYIVYIPQGSDFAAGSYVKSFSRGGSTHTDTADGVSIDSNVDTAAPGVYEVTYTVDTSYTRLIVVVE